MKKLLLSLTILGAITASAQKNLIKNGSFEMEFANWRGNVAKISPFIKKSGKGSCMINQFVGAEWKGIDQIMYIPKKAYAIEVSIWVKTDGVEGGKEVYNAGVAIVEFMNSGEKGLDTQSIAQVLGTTEWTQYKKLLIVPEKAKKLRMMLALAQTSGTVFFDGIRINTVSEEDYLARKQEEALKNNANANAETLKPKVLQNGDFEDQMNFWRGTGNAVLDADDPSNSYATISSTTNTWKAIDQVADVPQGTKSIKFSGWLKAQDIVQGENTWNNGMFIVEFTSDGKNKTSEDQLIGTVTGTTEWTFFEKELPVPEGSKKYRIMLAMSVCTGTLLADRVQAEMISE